ncbi:MAG: nucleotidyltransferase family protein [bacterium]
MSGDLLTPLWRASALPPLTLPQWALLISQARQARLLARLATTLQDRGELPAVPEAPRRYLEGALATAERQRNQVRWEIDRLRVALADIDGPIVLLKGGAYVAAALPPARGRLFGDIDFMVPQAQLPAVEGSLLAGGWTHQSLDPYDDRYYRRWMHELPPFKHVWRHTWLDVHHTITPPTSRHAVEAAPLFAAAVPVPGLPRFAVLAPCDMVLHSAAHVMLDGELPHGLRDLLDLDDLLRHFGARDPGFWPALAERAAALKLDPLLMLALRQLEHITGTVAPPSVASSFVPLARPRPWARSLLARVLRPMHPSCDDPSTRCARRLWYIRSHYLRMRPLQLAGHLGRKAATRLLTRVGLRRET